MGFREIYEFGGFSLDPAARRLSEGSRNVPLPPKAFDVLVTLVRYAGQLVTKQELLDAIWRGAFVEEGIISVHVSGLRKVLGGDRQKFIETVSRSGYRFAATVTRMGAGPSHPRIAVLPAQPITTEILSDRDRYIGLTLADALIARLGTLKEVIVRPTRVIHQQIVTPDDAASAGRSLNVDIVVDSHFLRVGKRLRVSIHLIGARAGSDMWSGEFEEPADDFAGLAESISQALASFLGLDSGKAGLHLKMSPHVKKPRTPRPACRPEVYEVFGRGRAHLLANSMFELPDAIAELQKATSLDPEYAAAHATLALAYCAQAEFRMASPLEAYEAAKASALCALAMDDSCADAQVALGAVLVLSEWDWSAAKRALERALELNPNHTEAYLQYGRLLEALGQLEEGLELKLRAMERDPFSPLVHLQISLSYWNQRRYDDAIQWAQKTLHIDPRHPHAREHLAAAYLKSGDLDRYMAESIKHAKVHGASPAVLEALKRSFAEGGRGGVVRFALDHAPKDNQGAAALMMAILSGESGELDNAFAYLDTALGRRDPGVVYLAVGPQWDSLRSDPRFDICLARMGLPRLPLKEIK